MDLRDAVKPSLADILARISLAETSYREMPKLALKSSLDEPIKKLKKDNTAESFVRKFFDKFNKEFLTVDYQDNSEFCETDTRRSIEDVYRLAYAYFGQKFSLVDIICETYKRVLQGDLTANYCYRINRRVYKNRPAKNGSYFDPRYTDELGFMKEHYDILINYYNNK